MDKRDQMLREYLVAPFTGAWIEKWPKWKTWDGKWVSHPSRVRGLKIAYYGLYDDDDKRRTLHGCVD